MDIGQKSFRRVNINGIYDKEEEAKKAEAKARLEAEKKVNEEIAKDRKSVV